MKIKEIDALMLEADIESIDSLNNEELEALRKKYSRVIEESNTKPKKKTKASTETTNKNSNKKYKFPFLMYFGHDYRDVSHMFEAGKEYTESEITQTLASHGYKEFKIAPKVEYEYFADENCLFPKFKVGNRG